MKALKTIPKDFYQGLKTFFEELNIPLNYLAEEPADPAGILTENYANPKGFLWKGIPLGQGGQLCTRADARSLFPRGSQ